METSNHQPVPLLVQLSVTPIFGQVDGATAKLEGVTGAETALVHDMFHPILLVAQSERN